MQNNKTSMMGIKLEIEDSEMIKAVAKHKRMSASELVRQITMKYVDREYQLIQENKSSRQLYE